MKMLYETIEGWFNWEAINRLVVRLAPSDRESLFVEVGIYKGKSVIHLAELIKCSGKPIRVVAVDTWDYNGRMIIVNTFDYLQFLRSMIPFRDIIYPIRASSIEVAKEFKDEEFDYGFIDAAHDYPSVCADIDAWKRKIRKGGIIAGHDYQQDFPGVIQAVNEAFPEGVKAWKYCWIKRI